MQVATRKESPMELCSRLQDEKCSCCAAMFSVTESIQKATLNMLMSLLMLAVVTS